MQIGASYTAQWLDAVLEQICYIYMPACLAGWVAGAFTEAISETTFHTSLTERGTILFTPI